MYLVDSSLWIDFFRKKGSASIKQRIRRVLQEDQALTCGIIIVEVIRGARNEDEYSALKESLASLPQIPMDEDVCERAADWGFQLDRKGRIASTTDLLIAASAFGKASLLHNDADYEMIARDLPLTQERLKV